MTTLIDGFKTSDGLQIHTRVWLPSGSPRAVIVLVHGIGEHIQRYEHVARAFTEAGFAVYGLDHRGHGQSEGTRAHFDNFDQPVADLRQYFLMVKEAVGNLPIIVYGHSMGSLISLIFTLRYQSEIAALISTGTPLNVDATLSPALIAVGKLLGRIVPLLPFGKLDIDGLSTDPAVATAYRNDPLILQKPTRVGIGLQVVVNGQKVREQVNQLTLPMLILHGEDDPVCPASGSRLLDERAQSDDKTLTVYPGMYHEVHNEVEKDRVISDILAWLEARF